MNNIVVGDFTLSPDNKTLAWQGKTVRLNQQQISLLRELMLKPGEPIHRDELHREVFPASSSAKPSKIDSMIPKLMMKVSKAFGINFRHHLVAVKESTYSFYEEPRELPKPGKQPPRPLG